MEMRDRVMAEMKQAMKDKNTTRVSTLRLINAAIKDIMPYSAQMVCSTRFLLAPKVR